MYCRAVDANSVLRGDMELVEPEAENAAPCNLYYAPLSFLAQIGTVIDLRLSCGAKSRQQKTQPNDPPENFRPLPIPPLPLFQFVRHGAARRGPGGA